MDKNNKFSIDSNEIIQMIRDYLIDSDYQNKSTLNTAGLVEDCLVNFSILKLYEWGYNVDELSNTQLTALNGIAPVINSFINDEKIANEYFMEYCKCIIYFIKTVTKKTDVTLEFKKFEGNTLSKTSFNDENNTAKVIINEDTPMYQVPRKVMSLFNDIASSMDYIRTKGIKEEKEKKKMKRL